ncbi:MAG: FlgO family outer membrane protein [Nitrospira sp.]|nr:FlgO family outer membrane protein [Nitrospira sp.]
MIRQVLAITGLLFGTLLSGHVFAAGNYEESLKLLADGVIAESLKAKKERLAIIDFTDAKGAVTPIGQFLAEELGTQLLVAGELKVVEHKLVSSTLKKRHITQIEATSPKALKGAAKAIRTDVFVTGSYLDAPEGILVTVKLMNPSNAQAIGAARGMIPKAGPLGEMVKEFNKPPAVKVEPPKGPTTPEGLGFHRNEFYELVVRALSRQDNRIRMDLTIENRSPRDVKLLCLLQNTVLRDDQGGQWSQSVEGNREGLCTRGIELSPREKDRAVLTFVAPADSTAVSQFTFSFHEKSPRRDATFTIEGLAVETSPTPVTPATP